jgi:glycosyltransferase involved in cell wall biosynthesis
MNQDNKDILVSISCITYNHAPYIRECLDGFMMQQTNFPFEVLIHDDASTDGTTEIIKEYEAKYPNIIKPLYEEENQWVKGRRGSAVFNFPRAQGKYIALCEGDDYWTDPLKLQKQVDFLESHPDYVMCSHRFNLYIQNKGVFQNDWYGDRTEGVNYNLNTLIHGGWFFHPLTVMFRSDKLDLDEYSQYKYSMDAVLFFHLLKKGEGYMMSDNMSVYRIHSGGVWSSIGSNNQIRNEFKARIGLYEVEQSYEAAFFLRNQFTKGMSRKWMLREWNLMMSSFRIISKHMGLASTLNLFLSKFLLNRDLIY